MHTEYEVRILNVDVEEIKRRLDNIGAKFEWDRLQKRYVYDFIPKISGKWIRLRTNGDKTTLTIKNLVSSRVDGTQELEIEVDDFDVQNVKVTEVISNYENSSLELSKLRLRPYESVIYKIDSIVQ